MLLGTSLAYYVGKFSCEKEIGHKLDKKLAYVRGKRAGYEQYQVEFRNQIEGLWQAQEKFGDIQKKHQKGLLRSRVETRLASDSGEISGTAVIP